MIIEEKYQSLVEFLFNVGINRNDMLIKENINNYQYGINIENHEDYYDRLLKDTGWKLIFSPDGTSHCARMNFSRS